MPEGLCDADGLLEAAGQLRELLAGFDPAGLAGPQCAEVVQELARTEKACAAARALTATRAVAANAHKAAGFASGAEWLAAHMGSTAGEARMAMGAAEALGPCPEALAALVAGELSLAQAHEIAAAHAEAPGAEHNLVDLARRSGLTAVRDAVRDRILQQSDPARLYESQRRKREFHHWRDRDGMVRWSGAFTPEVGVPIINRLEVEAERLRAAARRAGPKNRTQPT